LLKMLITQNIDNLHYRAGSRNIVEFHGNSRLLVCLSCGAQIIEINPEPSEFTGSITTSISR
jgi:NAD-dependent SIR2 family protein deacetylase